MDARTKRNLLVTVVGVSLFVALMNFSMILGFAGEIISLVLPVIVGGILALFINVPMNGMKKWYTKLLQKRKKKPSDKQILILSFFSTVLCVVFVLALVLILLIPELVRSSQSLYVQIEERLVYLEGMNFDVKWLENLISEIDLDKISQSISSGVDVLIVNVVEALSSTISIVTTGAFAIIIAVYMTIGKERLCRHTRKLICAYLKPDWSERILYVSRKFSQSFSNFLIGQCSEAIILGTLMFLAFTIFSLPYGSLVGVLTAVCAIIPYVGAFISCIVSVFLTLIIDPTLAIRCFIVYMSVQFIENQFIYPRVVGGSVGLPPLYTLIAAMIGGKLFGIIGIIFFIPLAAVVIDLVKEDATKRLNNREKEVEKGECS